MQTTNMVDENIKRIGEMFPNCLTERLNDEGKPEVAIDFDQLRQELSKDIVEGNEERYQFTWPDKRNAIRLANAPTTDTLRPCREESVDFDNTQNLYIEGDNLQVLKLLRENYLGKVKMIYIDPPYNTGKDFVYNDVFDQEKEEYIHNSGQYDEEGNRLVVNTESNGRFHTDWLNMIYPRLKVAKDLLSENGVLFISIDENELENMLKLCNEIFGNENVDTIIWQKQDSKIDRNTNAKIINRYKSIHENIVICFRNKPITTFNKIMRLPDWKGVQKNVDNDPRGNWQSGIISFEEGHAKEDKNSEYYYSLKSPSGIVWTRHWFYTKTEMEELISDNRVYFGKAPDYSNVPRLKTFENEEKEYYMDSIMRGVGTSSSAKDEIEKVLGNRELFDTPKPTKLIMELIRSASDKNSIVLDFFSGSATTAHAVMQLNAEDGGNRKFIMVQLPEETDEKSEAYKAGYKNICEIGKERIRRAGKKTKEEHPEAKDLDTGFRVLKLDSSNMEDVYYTPAEFSQQNLFSNNIKEDRNDEDLLFQSMIELGISLSAKIEKKQIAGKTVWSVEDNYLLACFDEDVNETTITEIAKQKPYYFIMRDSSLSNDNVADNFEQIFNHYSKDTIRRIL